MYAIILSKFLTNVNEKDQECATEVLFVLMQQPEAVGSKLEPKWRFLQKESYIWAFCEVKM